MNEEMLRKIAELITEYGDSDVRGVKDRMDQLIMLAVEASEEQKKQTALLSAIAEKLGVEEKATATKSPNESAFK